MDTEQRQLNSSGTAVFARGYTLIEVIVALSIFGVVMAISGGSLISVLHANNEARATQIVMNNMNFVLEEMSRQIRLGSEHDCGNQNNPGSNTSSPDTDCSGGGYYIEFISSVGDTIAYRINGTQIEKQVNAGPFLALTAPEVTINSLKFFVRNTDPTDNEQPQIMIVVDGEATEGRQRSHFIVQTTLTQRLLDS